MNITEPTITESLIQTDTNHYTATLDFYPLSAVYDNGEYRCITLVTANTTDSYITNVRMDASADVVVEGKYSYFIMKHSKYNNSDQFSVSGFHKY